jgi:hypothetical protein
MTEEAVTVPAMAGQSVRAIDRQSRRSEAVMCRVIYEVDLSSSK